MKKKISVVTGGAGFIGSHMVDLLLKEGHEVRIIDNFKGGHRQNLEHLKNNPDVKIWKSDITKLKKNHSAFAGSSYIFHFAGIGDIVPSITSPEEYFNVNVMGTMRVMECAREARVEKVVYAASSSCYGLANTPTSEDHPIETTYPYALSKYQGEQIAFHWGQVYDIQVNSICIFNAYGPRVRTTGAYGAVFGVFLRQKLEGAPLTVVGDGSQSRDFVYVTDVVKGFYLAAITDIYGQRYNLGAGNPQTIKKLAKLIGGKIVFIPKRAGEPESTHANITKISEELCWRPCVNFSDGVDQMLNKIQDWQNAPLWNPENIKEATKEWHKYIK